MLSRFISRSPIPFTLSAKRVTLLASVLVVLPLLALAWTGGWFAPAQAAPADCGSGNVPSFIDSDTTLPQELYVTDNVTIRDGATVTLTAGTQVTMCGAYQWWVQDARLLALGTETEPVVFAAQSEGPPWQRIYIGGGGVSVQPSELRHVVLEEGGGSDATAETGALHIYSPGLSVDAGPVLDHVTVQNSGSYGIYIRMDEEDPDPLSLTNLTVSGSARAPLMLYVSAMRGLGGGHTLMGNNEDMIEVRAGTVGGGIVNFDQRWLAHDVPYHVVSASGGITLKGDNNPILTLDPGVTLLMGAGADVEVQTGGLVAEGTAGAPVTFTRPSDGSPQWERIMIDDRFSESESRLSHVIVEHAGHPDGAIFLYDGTLSISNATIRRNGSAGVTVNGGFLEIGDSTIADNAVGVEFRVGSQGVLRRNSLTDNAGGAVVNDDSRGSCVDAMGNYWGSADGPADDSDQLDDCNLTATYAGAGNAVSDNVLYDPWLTGAPGDAESSASTISPDPFWVVANGVDSATLTVTLRDVAGNPLPGKEVVLQTTRGVIQQPAGPTDENGMVTAQLTSEGEETGGAIITARNVSDGQPLAAIAAVYFWKGGEETAGMVSAGGVPYASPQLELDGQPFELGFPMTFRLPMQNSNAVEASVVVTYAVSNLGIEARFTPVKVVSDTLQPAQSWDAEATWYPPSTGHRCVRATMKVTFPDGAGRSPAVSVTVGPWQINFDVPDDPCKAIDVKKLIPNSAGLSGARKHVTKGVVQAYVANECIKSHLGGSSSRFPALAANERDYNQIVTPPPYDPPLFEPDGAVTQAQADAANALVDTAYRLAALDEARLVTAERIRAAGQAGEKQAAARQREAYGEFQVEYADQLEVLANAIDEYLTLTRDAGVPDTTFLPEDYQAYLASVAGGYDAETVAFHQAAGLPDEAIETIRQAEIARLEEQPPQATSYYRFLGEVAGGARRLALELEQDYVIAGGRASARRSNSDEPLTASFAVGNPTGSRATVDLLVRPVDVPLSWSYSLDKPEPTLDPGETTTVTLTIVPAGGQAEGRTVQLAVEGFIRDDYVGGILFERSMAAVEYAIYLPAIIR